MRRFKPLMELWATLFFAALATAADAATITLNIQYNTSYDANFNPKGPELNAGPAPFGGWFQDFKTTPSDIHQFDIFMTITGLAAGEDFETLVFDTKLGPGVTPWSGGAYSAGFPLYDPPPNTANGCGSGCLPVFSNNLDAGTNTNDLKAITVIANSTNNFAGSHTRHPGETEASSSTDPDNSNLTPPTFLGSVFVNYDCCSWEPWFGYPRTYVGLADPIIPNPWSTRDANNVQHLYGGATMDQSPEVMWYHYPSCVEPNSSVLLIVGLQSWSLMASPRKGARPHRNSSKTRGYANIHRVDA